MCRDGIFVKLCVLCYVIERNAIQLHLLSVKCQLFVADSFKSDHNTAHEAAQCDDSDMNLAALRSTALIITFLSLFNYILREMCSDKWSHLLLIRYYY